MDPYVLLTGSPFLPQLFSTVTSHSGMLLHMLGVGLTLEEADSLQAKVVESQLSLEEVTRETKSVADKVRE